MPQRRRQPDSHRKAPHLAGEGQSEAGVDPEVLEEGDGDQLQIEEARD